jgi:hypothetical protein
VSSLLPQSKKLRIGLLVGAGVVVVGLIVGILIATSGGGGNKAKPHKPTATADAKTKNLELAPGTVFVQSVGPAAKLQAPVKRAVMAATQQYFDDAIQAPLVHGQVKNAYEKVFDPGVNGLASTRDRAALTEGATGLVRGPVHMTATAVRIDALGDETGKVTFAATTFKLQVEANTPAGKLSIKRHTELTFTNELGKWVVTAYRVTVRRSVGGQATTTTVRAGTATT